MEAVESVSDAFVSAAPALAAPAVPAAPRCARATCSAELVDHGSGVFCSSACKSKDWALRAMRMVSAPTPRRAREPQPLLINGDEPGSKEARVAADAPVSAAAGGALHAVVPALHAPVRELYLKKFGEEPTFIRGGGGGACAAGGGGGGGGFEDLPELQLEHQSPRSVSAACAAFGRPAAPWYGFVAGSSGPPANIVAESLACRAALAGPLDALRAAAEAGDAPAIFAMGCRCSVGDDMTESAEQAAGWFRSAAEKGLAAAQFRLGHAHFVGKAEGAMMSVPESKAPEA